MRSCYFNQAVSICAYVLKKFRMVPQSRDMGGLMPLNKTESSNKFFH